MEITAGLVKELREKTGLGMMECKKALGETNGDIEKAVEFLRKRGALKAEGKSDRATSEGVIGSYISDDAKTGSIVEVNCETDFVARSDDFLALVNDIALHAAKSDSTDNITEQKFVNDSSKTINDLIKEKIAKLGENITVKQAQKVVTEGGLGSYIHSNKKVGVLVELGLDKDMSSDEIQALTKDIAMHVAASSPKYVTREHVDQDFLNKEKEIMLAQSGDDLAKKPENIREKIITGRMDKIFAQVCLVEQPFVKNPDQTVGDLVKGKATIKQFVRYSLG
ncbi:MAG: translation elongation factor Ts [Candidatus Sericytochromatia bacterium]